MAHHRIRQGLDIPIAGEATGGVVDLPLPATVAYDPQELRGFIPRLAAREGERVKKGQPVLFHKFSPSVALVAPASGVVKEVRRGARRVITDLVIETDGRDDAVEHKAWSPSALASIPRDAAREQLLAAGLWPLLRTRPLDHVPDPAAVPQAILICGTETGPLQPGADVLTAASDKEALQAGVHVLKALTDGRVYLTLPDGVVAPALQGIQGVEEHVFSGPHPAGDAAVQVSHLDPPAAGRRVWYLRAWDAVSIGRAFLTGQLDATRVYAATGTGLKQPRFVRSVIGAPVAHLAGETVGGELRWIRGSVLTGTRTSAGRWAGLYTRSVHVMREEVTRRTFGWALPQLGLWSAHRAFLSGFSKPAKRYDMQPALHGGHRAIVPIDIYDQVIATPDIRPTFLFKSILAEDLEGSIKLGMLDISEEEAALCSYVCPAKLDYDLILRQGLETYAKEA